MKMLRVYKVAGYPIQYHDLRIYTGSNGTKQPVCRGVNPVIYIIKNNNALQRYAHFSDQ